VARRKERPTHPLEDKPPAPILRPAFPPQVVPKRPDYRCTRCQKPGAKIKTSRQGMAWLTCPAGCTDEDGSVWFKLPVER
jgi:hypothetical protein